MLTGEKGVFALALRGQRIEADQGFVDEPGMTHDKAALRLSVEKLSHQRAVIGLSREIVSAGESDIESDMGARGAGAKLRAQDIEKQRLGRAEPQGQGLVSSALANPGAGRCVFHRRQKRVTDLRKYLRMLVSVNKIRGRAEHFLDSR